MNMKFLTTKRKARLCALAALAAGMLFPGCGTNELNDLDRPLGGAGSAMEERSLGVRMEPLTKVSVGDSDGACDWTSGDAIAVRVYGTTPAVNKYETPTVNVSDNTVLVPLTGDQDIKWYSVYPAAARVDGAYGNPSLQVKYSTSHTLPSGLSAAERNNWSPLPMVAANTTGSTPNASLTFFHVGGVLRLKLSDFPSTATSCTVTLEGMPHITGTYTVSDPGTVSSQVTLSGTGTGNTVTFNGIPSGSTSLWLNVPLPTGDYASLSAVKVSAGGSTVTKAAKWSRILHGQGRRMEFSLSSTPGPFAQLNIGSTDPVTLWKGQTHTRTAQACDNNGIVISGATVTWSSDNSTVAAVNNSGQVTANAAGSATLTARCTHGGTTLTASYTVHVNEITGISLSCGTNLSLRRGVSRPVTATVEYTTNGIPQVPQVQWSFSSGVATLAATTTDSGAPNSIRGSVLGAGTLTVRVPANSYGTNALVQATCAVEVIGTNFVPGKFSVSDTKQVYFASGNLQVNYTNNGGTVTREWLFSENQWDYFMDDLSSFPPPAGTTIRFSHFQWATAGHKNQAGDYGYDDTHTVIYPHSTSTNSQIGVALQTWRNTVGEPGTSSTWNSHAQLRSYCDWGIHFDDDGIGDDNKYDGNWYTLSMDEWLYIFYTRPNASDKFAEAYIYDSVKDRYIKGTVIVPDIWVCPPECNFVPRSISSTIINTYSPATWEVLEESGAIFLPAAGAYAPTTSSYIYNLSVTPISATPPIYGIYHSSSYPPTTEQYILCVHTHASTNNSVATYNNPHKPWLFSVRLVHD